MVFGDSLKNSKDSIQNKTNYDTGKENINDTNTKPNSSSQQSKNKSSLTDQPTNIINIQKSYQDDSNGNDNVERTDNKSVDNKLLSKSETCLKVDKLKCKKIKKNIENKLNENNGSSIIITVKDDDENLIDKNINHIFSSNKKKCMNDNNVKNDKVIESKDHITKKESIANDKVENLKEISDNESSNLKKNSQMTNESVPSLQFKKSKKDSEALTIISLLDSQSSSSSSSSSTSLTSVSADKRRKSSAGNPEKNNLNNKKDYLSLLRRKSNAGNTENSKIDKCIASSSYYFSSTPLSIEKNENEGEQNKNEKISKMKNKEKGSEDQSEIIMEICCNSELLSDNVKKFDIEDIRKDSSKLIKNTIIDIYDDDDDDDKKFLNKLDAAIDKDDVFSSNKIVESKDNNDKDNDNDNNDNSILCEDGRKDSNGILTFDVSESSTDDDDVIFIGYSENNTYESSSKMKNENLNNKHNDTDDKFKSKITEETYKSKKYENNEITQKQHDSKKDKYANELDTKNIDEDDVIFVLDDDKNEQQNQDQEQKQEKEHQIQQQENNSDVTKNKKIEDVISPQNDQNESFSCEKNELQKDTILNTEENNKKLDSNVEKESTKTELNKSQADDIKEKSEEIVSKIQKVVLLDSDDDENENENKEENGNTDKNDKLLPSSSSSSSSSSLKRRLSSSIMLENNENNNSNNSVTGSSCKTEKRHLDNLLNNDVQSEEESLLQPSMKKQKSEDDINEKVLEKSSLSDSDIVLLDIEKQTDIDYDDVNDNDNNCNDILITDKKEEQQQKLPMKRSLNISYSTDFLSSTTSKKQKTENDKTYENDLLKTVDEKTDEKDSKLKSEIKSKTSLLFYKKYNKSVTQMKRSDLEEIVLQKVAESCIYTSERSLHREKIEKLEEMLIAQRNRINKITKQYRDLYMIHNRIVKDLQFQNAKYVMVVKITRAVGLQVLIPRRSDGQGGISNSSLNNQHLKQHLLQQSSRLPTILRHNQSQQTPNFPSPPPPVQSNVSTSQPLLSTSTAANSLLIPETTSSQDSNSISMNKNIMTQRQQQSSNSIINTSVQLSASPASSVNTPVQRQPVKNAPKITPLRPDTKIALARNIAAAATAAHQQQQKQQQQQSLKQSAANVVARTKSGIKLPSSKAIVPRSQQQILQQQHQQAQQAFIAAQQQQQQRLQSPLLQANVTAQHVLQQKTVLNTPKNIVLPIMRTSQQMSQLQQNILQRPGILPQRKLPVNINKRLLGAGASTSQQQQQTAVVVATPIAHTLPTDENSSSSNSSFSSSKSGIDLTDDDNNDNDNDSDSGTCPVHVTTTPRLSPTFGMVPGSVAPHLQLITPSAAEIIRRSTNHPAPLPAPPIVRSNPCWRLPPPRPTVRINNIGTAIVISWTMDTLNDSYAEITNYQIYAYQETSAPLQIEAWRHVGYVKAILLPMAVTLTQFQEKQLYYFVVRAVDMHGRCGQFSIPQTWE